MAFEIYDRIPTLPNRKKLTFEDNNEVRYATVEWADEPTQEGSFLDRAFFEDMLSYIFGTVSPEMIGALQIECGTYDGTNTYGVDNPNTLILGFEPKILIISQIARTQHTVGGKSVYYALTNNIEHNFETNINRYFINYDNEDSDILKSQQNIFEKNGNVVSWYSAISTMAQFNASSYKLFYAYVAIG